jgi:erythromycin esterase-like protein
MVETLEALLGHLDRPGRPSRVVVWAHNSHLGDARATEMGAAGQLNVGRLVRERHGDAALLVGFTTAVGGVVAADEWDAPGRVVDIRPPLRGSLEALLHAVGEAAFTLDLAEPAVAEALGEPCLERAIGVIYRPRTERASHYFHAVPADQFDMLVHVDTTTPVRPLAASRLTEAPADLWPTGV